MALFNLEGDPPIVCGIHRTDSMMNVVAKRCIYNGCSKYASFNVISSKELLYCAEHKTDIMKNMRIKPCKSENCMKVPKFNTIDKKVGLYCYDHRLENMIDVSHKRCNTYLCDTRVSNKQYEGYCLRCFVHTYPYKPVSRNYKTKERATVDTVLEKFPDISWVCDKTIEDGCSLKRPDIRGDMGSHVVIIEVDENHHSLYDCSCENKRIMQISQDVGHRHIVFIRFNPDDYTDINNNKITSCWGANKLGIMVVKPTKLKEWEDRIKSLHEQIQYWIDNVPEKMVETIQLFY
jgi:hypothetical protein